MNLFIFFNILYISSLRSEYRVFQYYVRPKIQNLYQVNAEIVTSTLNPTSYIAYHGGKESVEVNLLRSWQCMGNTSKLQPCSFAENVEIKNKEKVETP